MSKFSKVAQGAAVTALLVSLTGCGGGSDSPPQQANPPPTVPAPPPPPPPPPSPSVPPLSSVVTNIDAGQQIGVDRWPNNNTADGGQGEDVMGVPCVNPVPDNYHVHAHVSIMLDGVAQSLPANVGIVPSGPNGRCFYLLHTHDKSGQIHMEAAAPTTFTLGQLFAIWGQPLETDNVAGMTGMPIVVYKTENATVERVDSDWSEIELNSKTLITIQVGTPLTEIPNFSWTSN